MDKPTATPRPKDWILGISPYVPGKAAASDGRALVKLSANENPLGTSAAAMAVLNRPRADASFYPDPDSRALRAALADGHGLEAERIVCGTGSGELLALVARGYAGPGDEIVYVRYGFSLYDIVARACGANPIVAPDDNFATDVDAVLACVTPRTRLVFVANPNNPTGTFSSRDEIARLHAGLPADVVLVIDQAYAEYLEPEEDDGGLELARRHDNVLVVRTFSKIYGLAAERLGWGYGAPGIIDTLNRIRGPFNATTSAQAAALAVLGDRDFVARARRHNAEWRAWFADRIAALGNAGLVAVPSKANFLLVRFTGALSAEAALHGLAEAGYAVRWLPGQGLPDALRITIGSEADMRAVAATLRAMAEAAA